MLKFMARHKWHVFWACVMLDVPLWNALIHDWTKFMPAEWFAHVHAFFEMDGTPKTVRRSDGSYNVVRVNSELTRAWLNHQCNKHHWQAWVAIGAGGDLVPVPIPDEYIREMVADFIGAGKANHSAMGARLWYARNAHTLLLEAETRKKLEHYLEVYGG